MDDNHSPVITGVFPRVHLQEKHMFQVLSTLTKTMEDGRVSTWRFIQTTEGFCSVGGNYKLLQYRDKASMEKSVKWYLSKGYTQVQAAVAA